MTAGDMILASLKHMCNIIVAFFPSYFPSITEAEMLKKVAPVDLITACACNLHGLHHVKGIWVLFG